MLARTSRVVLLLAALAAISACQSPDVGEECAISWGDPSTAPKASEVSAEYVEFNAGNGCENLVCIISPAPDGTTYGSRGRGIGYCSKPCVSNRDCYQSETDLVCRTIVLDEAFLGSLDPVTRERYLGDIQYSSYCAVEK